MEQLQAKIESQASELEEATSSAKDMEKRLSEAEKRLKKEKRKRKKAASTVSDANDAAAVDSPADEEIASLRARGLIVSEGLPKT